MLTIILLIVLTVLGFVGAALINQNTYDYDGLSVCLCSIGILSFLSLIAGLTMLININKRFDAVCNNYDNIVQMVESYDGQDYGNMGSLVEAVVGMNKTIAVHKAQYNSKWVGLWHSERIASLEPITFSPKRVEPVQTE